jgi:hypothetical protein
MATKRLSHKLPSPIVAALADCLAWLDRHDAINKTASESSALESRRPDAANTAPIEKTGGRDEFITQAAV